MPKTFSCMTRATLSLHGSALCENNKVSTFFKALNEKKWEQVQTQAEELIQILKKSSIELNHKQWKLLLDHLTAYDVPQENQHNMALLMRGFCVRQMSSAHLEKDFCQTFKTWFQSAQENLKSHPQVYAECFILQGIVEANEEVIEAKSPAPILAGLEKIVQGMHQFSWKLDKEQRQQLPKPVRLLFYKYTLLEEFKNAEDYPKGKAKLNIKLIERTRKNFEEENLEYPSSSETKADSHYRKTKKNWIIKAYNSSASLEALNAKDLKLDLLLELFEITNSLETLDTLSCFILQFLQSASNKKRKNSEVDDEVKGNLFDRTQPRASKKKKNNEEALPDLPQNLGSKALAWDSKLADAYNNLINTLASHEEEVELPDGTKMSKRSLCLKAIALDPLLAGAYSNLANTLAVGEKVELPDGSKMSKQSLYLKALELDPKHARAHTNFGASLVQGEEVELPDGTKMNRRSLHLRAIALDSHLAIAYNNLATTLEDAREEVELPDGSKMSRQSLYLKALVLDPRYANVYNNLATILPRRQEVELPDGTKMSKRSLCLKALALNPKLDSAYSNLATTLAAGEEVELPDETKMSRRSLYLKALALNPKLNSAYINLALNLAAGEEIELLDGAKMTSDSLWSRVIALSPTRDSLLKLKLR